MPRNRTILRVDKKLCLSCGLCAQICPQGAINLTWGKAEIDTRRCNSCYQCVDVCPQGAIVEMIVLSPEELRSIVFSLKQQTEDIIRKIDSLVSRA